MISMYTKQEIILRSHRDGSSRRQITRELGLSRPMLARIYNPCPRMIELDLFPTLEIGWLNGWILLCLFYLIYGVFLMTFSKDVRDLYCYRLMVCTIRINYP